MSRYEYIDSCRTDPSELNPVTKMCLWLAVSTSGFYHWLLPAPVGHRGPS